MRPPVPGIADRTCQRLLALVADDRPDPERLIARVREIGKLDDVPAFRGIVHGLVNLDLPDEEAERLLEEILAHREGLSRELERDPGLRVAALDFLTNVRQRLTHPMIVEVSRLEEMERSAVTDSLTGLYNRRYFRSALELELRRCRRYRLMLSLVMLDLDRFKRVNDRYGHLFGDLVLKRVARLVRKAIRDTDVACRYGGEEFAVILPETGRLGAYAVAERIRLRLGTAFADRPTGGRPVGMTISGGISTYPEDGRDVEGLISRADEALYGSKSAGRNRISLFHAERRAAVRYPARPTARVEVARAPEAESRPATMLNLSFYGALVETDERYRPEDPVRVRLEDHPGRAEPRRWTVDGRVVRVGPSQALPSAFRVGIAFHHPIPVPCLRAQTLTGTRVLEAVGGGSA